MSDQSAISSARCLRPLAPMALPRLPAEPLVSVAMANYNYARYLPRAIASLQGQTYQRWELVVCDDGSTDDSAAVLADLAARDPRIRLIRQANAGQTAATSAAYLATRGEVVCFMDSDDEFEPSKLAQVLAAFRQAAQAGVCTHLMLPITADGARSSQQILDADRHQPRRNHRSLQPSWFTSRSDRRI